MNYNLIPRVPNNQSSRQSNAKSKAQSQAKSQAKVDLPKSPFKYLIMSELEKKNLLNTLKKNKIGNAAFIASYEEKIFGYVGNSFVSLLHYYFEQYTF